jgi:hypothetical protein
MLVALLSIALAQSYDPRSAVLDAEGGTVTLKGKHLSGAVLQWRTETASGEDVCDEGADDGCTFAVPKGLNADPTALELKVQLPAALDAGVLPAAPFHPSRVLVERLLPPDAVVDLQADVSRVPLLHAEAIAGAECTDADCELDGSDLVVRREQGSDELLDLKLRLRPHVFFKRTGGGADAAPAFSLALQRCPVAFAVPPVRAAREQVTVVKISGRCAASAGLELASGGQRLTVLKRTQAAGAQWLAAVLPRAGDELGVSVQQGAKVVGVARATTRTLPALSARLEVPGIGDVDFLPVNREARVRLPVVPGGGSLVLLATEGAYDVRRDEVGQTWVRASSGGGGQVALRFGLRERALPDRLADLDLYELREPLDRRVDVATVPVALDGARDGLVELLCGDGDGHPGRVEPGVTAYVPFRAHDTCRLVLHRERLKPEAGPQQLQLYVRVVASDGTPRPDAAQDQRLSVVAAPAPTETFLAGVESAFDRLTVRLSREGVGAAQLQWSVVFGTSRLRLFATTSFPSGLFRVADEGHSGILTLNAGAIARLVWLSRDGHESPLGLEGGVMWVGIASDSDPRSATRGQIAAVIGAGLSVPIANQGHASQTSISLHGWFEYEVSRAFDKSGSPWGFVFGPALTIGDVGTNL